MEQEGPMASTIARRLSTLSSFYKYCQIEDIIVRNPAANIRRPKVRAESARWAWIPTNWEHSWSRRVWAISETVR